MANVVRVRMDYTGSRETLTFRIERISKKLFEQLKAADQDPMSLPECDGPSGNRQCWERIGRAFVIFIGRYTGGVEYSIHIAYERDAFRERQFGGVNGDIATAIQIFIKTLTEPWNTRKMNPNEFYEYAMKWI
jgi:hypothetical protein